MQWRHCGRCPSLLAEEAKASPAELNIILEKWVEVKHPKVAESWITSFEEAQISLSSESSTTLNYGQMCTNHQWDMWDSNTDEKTATLIALG